MPPRAVFVDEQRRLDFGVAPLHGAIQKERDERSLQACAVASVKRKARARHLCAAFEVDQAVLLGEVPMRLRREVERRLGPLFRLHLVVVLRLADGHAGMMQVGNAEQKAFLLALGLADGGFELFDALFQSPGFVDALLGFVVFALPLERADLARHLVLAGLCLLHLGDGVATLGIHLQ